MQFSITLILLFAVIVPAQAQESGLNFLRIGVNAAAGAMGDAQVAASRDAFSTYWNPAGLAVAPSNTAALSHQIWIADLRTYGVAARFRAGQSGGLGLAVTAVDSGDLEVRENGPGDPEGIFSAQFLSIGASYGRRLGPVRAGVTAKYLSERIFESSATGYAFDVGLQAGLLDEAVLLGAAVQNLGTMNELDAVATDLPQTVRAGVAVAPLQLASTGDIGSFDLLFSAEVSYLAPDEATRVHVGGAATLLDLITLRAGYITNDTLRDLTFGGGLAYGGLIFDYAYLPFESGFEGPGHLLTLHYRW